MRKSETTAVFVAIASPSGGQVTTTPQWPAKYQFLIDVLTTGSAGSLDDLKARSPHPTDVDTDVFIAALFPGNPWLCHAFSKGYLGTRLREDIVPGLLATSQFIVPSPMVAKRGMTKGPNPHRSEHTEAATGPRVSGLGWTSAKKAHQLRKEWETPAVRQLGSTVAAALAGHSVEVQQKHYFGLSADSLPAVKIFG